ncbi:hypothetical protein HBH56_217570 [Parastagonospora nodorum]|uniref:Uncharacterized protein n=1 Tax=Phaeosphaeria nodorum (strain SN15 / ATCC MYA-4574 / FGSC 10173) TaxID=321614 RepID=A0A7U2I944_PHANO|nr:hypothetical protein HBH56_217570 [Parastagonospora nodorum]QRD05465.1 hypothetical protein JI435_422490 [Parastagonospora nodorum SN15]KAH3922743.1 hypothetical protein HBH54_219430 [Parastagonospora nodorum]KAH4043628.1 hypothetical protein HBH49_229140 [Parastagonospora nodorum]KAH4058983.1 hypothetical protein HBH50_230410 [Parastagonospora nodorum]
MVFASQGEKLLAMYVRTCAPRWRWSCVGAGRDEVMKQCTSEVRDAGLRLAFDTPVVPSRFSTIFQEPRPVVRMRSMCGCVILVVALRH